MRGMYDMASFCKQRWAVFVDILVLLLVQICFVSIAEEVNEFD